MKQKKFKILGIPLTLWKKNELLRLIENRIKSGKQSYIVNMDLHKLVYSLRDYQLQEKLKEAEVIFLEGIALSLAARIFEAVSIQGIIEKKFIPGLFQIAKRNKLDVLILCESKTEIPSLKKHLTELYPEIDINITTYKAYLENENTYLDNNKDKSLILLGEVSKPDREFILKRSLQNPKVKVAHGFGLTYDISNNKNKGIKIEGSTSLLGELSNQSPLSWIKHFYSFLEFSVLLFVGILEETVIPYKALALETDRGHDLYRLGKRLFDIILSLTILTLSAPLLIFIAVLIKLDSKGPVFFRQKRAGYKGKDFTILKFRTMKKDVLQYDHSPNSSQDKRITRVGRYLRKTSLDELPQFLNVLKGDMSVVGPRPEMPFKANQYSNKEKKRLTVKTGVTGLWQLYGDRSVPIHKSIDYDFEYIDNRSFWLDLKIIILSFFHVLLTPLKSEDEWKQW
ncbi:MAG: sugar transferase [candidate division WOR-3 bacterium]|nr:sugar transferase [candidate division WOR-3 bacterium]